MSQLQHVRTPVGILPIIKPMAEKLLREGVISGTIDGELHAADAAIVKAAIMAASVCDFCSAPGADHYYDVPDFGITTDARGGANYGPNVGKPEGGWTACDVCYGLIQADKRKQLVDRSVETHAFPKFSKRAIEDMHSKFWNGMDDRALAAGSAAAIVDYVDDTLLVHGQHLPVGLTNRDRRIDKIANETGLPRSRVIALVQAIHEGVESGDKEKILKSLDRKTVAALAKWDKGIGGRARRLKILAEYDDGPRPPLPNVIPHWQRALESRFEAIKIIETVLNASRASFAMPAVTDLSDPAALKQLIADSSRVQEVHRLRFGEDIKSLARAQAYSFNGETTGAILEASIGLPHDITLGAIELPSHGAGWFWFADPMAFSGTPVASDTTAALLWSWQEGKQGYEVTFDEFLLSKLTDDQREKLNRFGIGKEQSLLTLKADQIDELGKVLRIANVTQDDLDIRTKPVTIGHPSIRFSTYIVAERGELTGKLVPSTAWYWPFDMDFHAMVDYNRENHRRDYGTGEKRFSDGTMPASEEETMRVVTTMSLFFVTACSWFKTKVPVLTQEEGHIERHARKRIQREHKLDEAPSVRVVALRAAERRPSEPRDPNSPKVEHEYHYRWVVKRHPRLQKCGPGLKDKRLIWIEAYVKGPADKPFRQRETVYSVIR